MRRVLLLVLFGAGAFLHFWLTFTDTSTEDEHVHIYAGAVLLDAGRTTINLEHPPLAKLLAAASLQMARPTPPDRVDKWQPEQVGYTVAKFVYGNRVPIRTILNFSRIPFVLLTLALAVVVFWFAQREFGPLAAWITAALTLFSPLVLAVGHLVHTDLPVTLLVTAAWLSAMRWAQSGNWRWSLAAGVLMGLALLTKFSSLVFFVILIGLALIYVRRRSGILLVIAAALIVAYLGMALSYHTIHAVDVYLGGIRTFLARGAIAVNYLAGEFSPDGWWYYFPVAFVLKTPTAVLLLLALAIGVRARRFDRTDRWLIAPVIAYFVASAFSTYNIGVRHLLPVYPLLHLFIGRAIAATERPVRLAGTGLAALALIETLVFYPHLMGYFNLLAGPRDNATLILSDSNVDWGQDNGRLRDRLAAEPATVLLMGGALPEQEIGPGFRRIDPRAEPRRGIYAVSRALQVELTQFATLPPDHPMRIRLSSQPRFSEPYGLFLLRLSQRGKRVARIGNSIDIYQVP